MKLTRLLLALALAACAAPRLLAQAPDGKALYEKNCRSCHGAGGAPPAALAKKLGVPTLDRAYLATRSDDSLVKVMSEGTKNMKPMKGKATAAELSAMAKYLRTMVGGKP